MPETGAYDLPSFSLAAMEMAAVADMALAMDLSIEE